MESETLYAETHYGTCELKAILSRLTADTSNTTLKISYNASDNVNWTPLITTKAWRSMRPPH
jgi:hypothetical protein